MNVNDDASQRIYLLKVYYLYDKLINITMNHIPNNSL